MAVRASIPPDSVKRRHGGPIRRVLNVVSGGRHMVAEEVEANEPSEDRMALLQRTGSAEPIPPAFPPIQFTPGNVLPVDQLEAFERFQRGLPMTANHVAIVAAVTVAGVACAVGRGRLRRRSMLAQAGFHPADVAAWLWGNNEKGE